MVNPITSKSHFERLHLTNCCFMFTLRTGSLINGIIELIIGILWLIGGISRGHNGYTGIISTVFLLASGIFTVLAIKKEKAQYMWYAIYLNIGYLIWSLIFIILLFASLYWGMAIGAIINFLIMLYFTSVLRSYAFEIESGSTAAPNPA